MQPIYRLLDANSVHDPVRPTGLGSCMLSCQYRFLLEFATVFRDRHLCLYARACNPAPD